MVVVETEGGDSENVGGRFLGFAFREFAFFLGFGNVEPNDLLEGAIGRLQLVDAIVIDIGQHHVALGI